MGKYRITGPDGATYDVEAPDGASEQDILSYVQKNAGAPAQPAPAAPQGSIYSQFPQELENPMGMGATLGASDAQMGDIVKKQLGDRFIRMESAPSQSQRPQNRAGPGQEINSGDYQVVVYRGEDGTEKRAYVNAPGLDTEDVTRAVRGALPQMVAGGVAGAATRSMGLLGQAIWQGVAGAGTSVAGDVAQIPLGSEQGVEGGKAVGMGLMGFGIPLASRAIGNVAGALKERMAPQTGPLKGMSPKAVRNVEESLAADPTLTPGYVRGVNQTYGPENMLADMSDTLRSDAAMLARTPIAKDTAAPAIRGRAELAGARIRDTLDNELGPQRNLPQYLEQQADAYNAQAKPYYDIFKDTRVKPSERLYSILDAAKASGAYDRAARKLQIKQLDPNSPENSGVFLDLIKRELDGMANEAKTKGNRTDFADLSGLARALRQEVDSTLSPNDPANSVWARARSISGEGLEGREAAELGSGVFGTTPKDPHLVQADLAGMSAHGKELYREGARNKLRQVMGGSASNFGPKGDAAARRALNSTFSRDNIDQVAGRKAAQNITDRIDAENQYARLNDMALGNSVTDTMQAARRRWAPHAESNFASEAGKKGPVGLATETVFRVADAMIGGQIKKAEARAMIDGAKILTATGRERDKVVEALFKHIEARKSGRISGQKFEKVVRALLETSRVPAVQQYQGAD